MYKKKWFKSNKVVADSFYSRTGREMLLEEDALSYEEDGFMQGYEEDWINDAHPEEII